MRGKIEVIWKLRDRPSRLISCGARSAVDWPLTAIDARADRKASRDQVEQRGLAGAVGADDGMPLAARDAEVDAADDLGRPEALAHVAQLDRRARLRRHAHVIAPRLYADLGAI